MTLENIQALAASNPSHKVARHEISHAIGFAAGLKMHGMDLSAVAYRLWIEEGTKGDTGYCVPVFNKDADQAAFNERLDMRYLEAGTLAGALLDVTAETLEWFIKTGNLFFLASNPPSQHDLKFYHSELPAPLPELDAEVLRLAHRAIHHYADSFPIHTLHLNCQLIERGITLQGQWLDERLNDVMH
ncbi:MAG: hypothetical protein MI808_22010 [Pseudomonadales bacterium]|nr:hypothetical protein [Pseudomonadales bacterium]